MSESKRSAVTYRSIISHSSDNKYIIGRIKNSATKEKTLVLVSTDRKYHSMIVGDFMETLSPSESFHVLGGGILTIDKSAKTIRTYGQSGSYGPADQSVVETILRKSGGFEDYTLDLTSSDYIRG